MSNPLESALVHDFNYQLPEERIAVKPVHPRDSSRLLCYRNGQISHHTYRELDSLLPAGTFLVFNDTKVIPARLHFKKPSGTTIEILLLNPESLSPALAMEEKGKSRWQTMIGNLKKWKPGEELVLQLPSLELRARLADRENRLVQLSWEPASLSFSEVLEQTGKIPLPPYIEREADTEDLEDYQTSYADKQGAVAAPTAGLHFTPELIARLNENTRGSTFLTLHVGAGTFKPMKSETAAGHDMHVETIVLQKTVLADLVRNSENLVAVGTTSLRTLESLYWWGVLLQKDPFHPFEIATGVPYEISGDISYKAALEAVLQYMEDRNLPEVQGKTGIFIVPGYRFRSITALITNFHQPQSTLLMLVAAWIGSDWKKIYQEAMEQGYRFLSFGDGSLLFRA